MTEPIAGMYTFEEYRDAFHKINASMNLDRVVTDPDELPEPVRDSIFDLDDVCAFHFSRHIEEYDEDVTAWIPLKLSEIREREDLKPDSFAAVMSPMLDQSWQHAVEDRKMRDVEEAIEEVDKEDDVDDAGSRNTG